MIKVNGVELMMVGEGQYINAAGILVDENNNPIVNNEGDVNMNDMVTFEVGNKIRRTGDDVVVTIMSFKDDVVIAKTERGSIINIKDEDMGSYEIVKEEVKMEKVNGITKYTVEVENGKWYVITKSGKRYEAVAGVSVQKFVADKESADASLLKAREMFKTIFPTKQAVAQFNSNPRPMFVADAKKEQPQVIVRNPLIHEPEIKAAKTATTVATKEADTLKLNNVVITRLRDALPIVYKNGGGRFCLPAQSKLKAHNIVFKCACCGAEVTSAAAEYCMNNQDKFQAMKGVALCKEDQTRVINGQPTMTSQERNAKRREAYLKAAYANRDRIVANNVANQGF